MPSLEPSLAVPLQFSAMIALKQYNEPIQTAVKTEGLHPKNQDETSIGSQSTSSYISSTQRVVSSQRVSSIRREELRQISLIGKGRFSNVHLASGPSWLIPTDPSSPKTNNRPTLVAVKSLDVNKIKDDFELEIAKGELANEAMILSELDHENIVKLRGVCSENLSENFGWGGYFLVFEILRETLSDRLNMWRRQKEKNKSLARKDMSLLSRITSKKAGSKDGSLKTFPELDERKQRVYLRIQESVLGITNGMEYLHSNGIVLRDLKPANIGYEDTSSIRYGACRSDAGQQQRSGSTVRLFDFGMAQKVEACDPLETCGSLRYMAPETIMGKGYSLKVDVYAFGVILYEITSLCHPFAAAVKPKKMFRKVPKNDQNIVEAYRERFLAGELVLAKDMEKSVCCPELRALIEECCAADPVMRPTFAEIRSRLSDLLL